MTTILVTGANGFVAKTLCPTLTHYGHSIKSTIRTEQSPIHSAASALPIVVGDIHAKTDWQNALTGVEVVIHLAARVHVMRETAHNPIEAFKQTNTDGTANLARQAAAAGVKRFIFLSSIKVLGESQTHQAFDHHSPANPQDPYALSKYWAEQSLQAIADATGMQVVIIRTPLIYGAGVKGNFLRLMHLTQRGWPLPLASIQNKRSMLYVENLCALITICVNHPAAANQTLLCADTEHFSTPELIRQIADALSVQSHLWHMPTNLLKIIATLLNKQAEIARLCDSLEIDSSHTSQLLNWHPPFTAKQGIAKTVAAFSTLKEI